MPTPTLSVITVTYNDKKGLEKTIKSVLEQTTQPFEFIVIDGGSTDGSKELLQKYSSQITYWVSEKDGGIYPAMNKGIRIAKGDFLIFMNGGDTFYETHTLEKIFPYLNYNTDIYYGNYNRVEENRSTIKTFPEKLTFSLFYSSSIAHQSSVIRRDLFTNYFYYSEHYKIVSDWEFFIYTICKANVPYQYLNFTLSNFDYTGVSAVKDNRAKADAERKQVLETHFPAFVTDYEVVGKYQSKRFKQVVHISRYKWGWKMLKGFISLQLLFLPKTTKSE